MDGYRSALPAGQADEKLWGYVRGAEPLPKSAWEFEQDFAYRWDKGSGSYDALDTKTEVEYGATERLELSAALFGFGIDTQGIRIDAYIPADEKSILRHGERVQSAVFSPDGRKALTASSDHTARLWDAASGKELAVLRHGERVESAAFSPDGAKVLTASWDHTARLWDAPSGKELAVLRHGGDKVSAVFSADGTKVLTVSWDNPARLWDAASGKELAVLRGHEMNPRAIAFSPDGRTVATGSIDNTARLWDAASGKELTVLRHGSWVTFVAFSPDGGTLATVSADDQHAVRLWPVGQRLIDRACARVHDLPLGDENKKRFGIEKEWCTPEVSAALRVKLGMDVVPEKTSASVTTGR